MKPDPLQIWMLDASNDDPGGDTPQFQPTVHLAGSSSGSPGRSGAWRRAIYAPGIQREEIEKLVLVPSVMLADPPCAGARLLVEALDVEAERLYRTTVLAFVALQRVVESQAAHLGGMISLLAATMSLAPRKLPDEPRSVPDAANPGDAILRFGSGTEVVTLINEAHAELNDIAINLMRGWCAMVPRFPWFA